ncbi:tripartite tricarboxylate transporter substrate binding protein [Achromobacter sp. GG226]|uniref:Bug family tripartite tricarboxylate transporter substrate binding protein n=1 Tax=Verticiella alkaliphila TaxID=2779529 RepID=UPI001C0D9543|nr:tripartite tricarboxylate transporter substrate binding protein [Verticiella sp. GG226]MBU4611715.1 tripartite tricarboxylate transporter substrate binding protein [Verticiella sp. GG226]
MPLPRLLTTVALAALPWTVLAADWPTRPVTMVVPAAPGGTTDIAARLLADRMSQSLGQTVLVENRAGAGGVIGTGAVARAKPDCHTILMGNIGPLASNYSLYRELPYGPDAFAPIKNVLLVPNILVVNQDSLLTSVEQLVAQGKGKALTMATSGIGQSPHMSTEMFKQRTGIDATLIPHSGAAPAVTALLGGQVDAMIDNLPSSLPHVQSGRFRALAVTSAERVAELPDVPTMAEAGVPDMVVSAWFGLVAPAGTPQPVIDRLYDAASGALKEPQVRERIAALGAIPGGEPPAEYGAFIQRERETWRKIVEAAGMPKQ